ncbi:MAG: orotidine-5'-phosphate decarboxylase [Actinomycetota bacterium]
MNPIIIALDVPTVEEAAALAETIGDAAGAFKVGLELYSAEGPHAVAAAGGRPVFLDLKLHDIPTTVARAVRALAPHRVDLLTVHALGGRAMLEAASDAKSDEKILAVTILTHLDDAALREVGLPPVAEAVPLLAKLAADAGCDGVVCAPTDLVAVRAACPSPFLIVTPGVRPAGSDRDEQVRALTPREAVNAGADRLVIGRPVTRARDPRAAAMTILEGLR